MWRVVGVGRESVGANGVLRGNSEEGTVRNMSGLFHPTLTTVTPDDLESQGGPTIEGSNGERRSIREN